MKKNGKLLLGLSVVCAGIGLSIGLTENGSVIKGAVAEDAQTITHELVFTAEDFTSTNGSITKYGNQFTYSNVSVSEGVVTIGGSGVFVNSVDSGSSKGENGYKGAGYTKVSFEGLKAEAGTYWHSLASGYDQLYDLSDKDSSYSIDLTATFNGVDFSPAKARTRYQLQTNAGVSCSFTKLVLTYACELVTPSVSISGDASKIAVGATATLTAAPADAEGLTPTYEWSSSDTAIATVTGDGATATVTGVKAGTATITVKMTADGKDYSAAYEITVLEKELETKAFPFVKDKCAWQGSGFWIHFDGASLGLAGGDAAWNTKYNSSTAIAEVFKVTVTGGNLGSPNLDNFQMGSGDNDVGLYMSFAVAPGTTDDITIAVTYAGEDANYAGSLKFKGNTLVKDLAISGDSTVTVGSVITLTATPGDAAATISNIEWSSSDDTIATVEAKDDNTATVTGVKAGSATITVKGTIGGEKYSDSFKLTVESADKEEKAFPFVKDKCAWQGAGFWIHFDGASLGLAGGDAAWNTKYNSTAIAEAFQIGVESTNANLVFNSYVNFQEGSGDNDVGLYINFKAAPGDTDETTLTVIYKTESCNYVGTLKYIGTTLQS